MAQAFVTTNADKHRWFSYGNPRKGLRPYDKLAETLPEGDIWLLPQKIEEDGESFEAAKLTVAKMLRRRLYTTYQVSYCPDMLPKEPDLFDDDQGESTLILIARELYKTKTQKIAPPLPTARRVFGYIRPVRMYTGLSDYQMTWAKNGYDVMVGNNARIKNRDPNSPCWDPNENVFAIPKDKLKPPNLDCKKGKKGSKCKCP